MRTKDIIMCFNKCRINIGGQEFIDYIREHIKQNNREIYCITGRLLSCIGSGYLPDEPEDFMLYFNFVVENKDLCDKKELYKVIYGGLMSLKDESVLEIYDKFVGSGHINLKRLKKSYQLKNKRFDKGYLYYSLKKRDALRFKEFEKIATCLNDDIFSIIKKYTLSNY